MAEVLDTTSGLIEIEAVITETLGGVISLEKNNVKNTIAGKVTLERTVPPALPSDTVAGNISISIWSIESSKRIAAILKLAQESCRAASYAKEGGNHVTAVRKLLMQYTGTTPWDAAGIAKNIVEVVKNDLAE